ncbi:Serine/threonine-protein kinase pim-3 [Quaeritorhiza haematococci]|nr:Serine/threonine-protein kinase pim-3 [Quaeritorhiza haematococci]
MVMPTHPSNQNAPREWRSGPDCWKGMEWRLKWMEKELAAARATLAAERVDSSTQAAALAQEKEDLIAQVEVLSATLSQRDELISAQKAELEMFTLENARLKSELRSSKRDLDVLRAEAVTNMIVPGPPTAVEDDEIIGSGGFGVVCRAALVTEPIVIKAVQRHKHTDWIYTAGGRVPREVYYSRKLQHPGIARCLGFNADDEKVYMYFENLPAMDWCDLHTFCTNHGPLDGIDAKKPTTDLKPPNIMVNQATLEIKLIDFGFADSVAPGVPMIAGGCTKIYAPPEYHRRQPVDPMAFDWWSIGCTIFECMEGCHAFQSPTDVLSGRPLTFHHMDASPELKAFVTDVVQHDANLRPTLKC